MRMELAEGLMLPGAQIVEVQWCKGLGCYVRIRTDRAILSVFDDEAGVKVKLERVSDEGTAGDA